MDLLFELAYIISLNPPASLSQLLPRKSKMRMLYDAILKDNTLTDEDAARLIYGSSGKDKKYLMLKRSLIQKLFELVQISEYVDPQEGNHIHIRFTCERELNIAEKLLLYNVYHNAEKIIQKTIRTAEKYSLLDIQLACLKKLRTIYSLKGFPAETQQFNQEIKVVNEYNQYLSAAIGMWEVLQGKVKFKIGRSEEIAREATSYAVQLHKYFEKTQNPFLVYYYLRIRLIEKYHLGQTADQWELFKKWIDLIEHHPHLKTGAMLLELNRDLGRYYASTGKMKFAEKHIEKSLEFADYRAFNKFELQADYFELFLKKARYQDAGEILKELYALPQFELLDPLDRAAWALREAYLFVVFAWSKQEKAIKKYTPNFKEQISITWLNAACQANSRDKQGYNQMFLLIRLLLLHLKGEEDLSSETNNLMVYYQRYLKELTEPKTRSFFKRFTKAARENFHKEYLLKQFETYQKEIAEEAVTDAFDPCEWVPYESFWQLAMQHSK